MPASASSEASLDPLAGLPGSEADAEVPSSAEIRGGARVLEVAQLLFGELRDLRYLESPRLGDRLRDRLRESSRIALALLGALTFVAAIPITCGANAHASLPHYALGLGPPMFWVAVSLIVFARSLRSPTTVTLCAGERPLVRWRRGRYELMVPAGASGELGGGHASRALESSGEERAVPIPREGRVRIRTGELEVRVAWVRPARRLPQAHPLRRPRWGIAAAITISFVVHQAALAVVLAAPPAPSELRFNSSFRRLLSPTRLPEPELTRFTRGPHRRAAIAPRLGGPPTEPASACGGQVPRPEVYLGHLTVAGPRPAALLRRTLERKLGPLAACYREVLKRCAGTGRIVLTLAIAADGSLSVERESAELDHDLGSDALEACVRLEAGGWRFSRIAARELTRVRVPILFRFAGAERFVPAAPE